MPHGRETIRKAVHTAILAGGTSAGANVTAGRVYPHSKANLPSVAVYTTEEEIDGDFETSGLLLKRTVSVIVECRYSGSSTAFPEDELDELCAEVEAIIGADPDLGGTIGWIRLASTEIELDGEQEKPVGLATLTYRAQYQTLASTPTTISG